MTAGPSKRSSRNALLDTLCATFPVFQECRPLSLGIHKTICERMPDVKPADLRLAMRVHTASTRYLKALAAGTARYDLDGQPAGEVTEEQRTVASEGLKSRFAKAAERRKADEQARKAQEADAARQEKLNQLAARFSKR